MSTEIQHEELINIIGLDETTKDMLVLGALLKTQKDPNDFVDFESLREQLAIEEGSRKGKDSLIYRSLSWLESEGFLKIDKGGHKHGYNSNIATIERALAKLVARTIKDSEKDLKDIDSRVKVLSDLNSDILASRLIEILAGNTRIEKPVFAQGWENIVKLLDDKVYSDLKKGDVVRIKLEWLAHIDYLTRERILNMRRVVEKGVEIRALDNDRGEEEIRPELKKVLVRMRETGGNVGYMVFPRKDATYQFVSRNTEGIVLVVSESPLSATWLPRRSNSELVDNAIEHFDKDYESGADLLDFVG
jgi:hypothetical protein